MIISLADYGVGNIHSIKKALENAGGKVKVISEMKGLLDSDCIVFPGVGAFDRTMERLSPFRDELNAILVSGIPALGVCIGTHILFSRSEEGHEKGFDIIPGVVKRLTSGQVPHMGWNSVVSDDPILKDTGRYFYFAHSYYGEPNDPSVIKGMTEHGGMDIPVLFRTKNIYGCQFHPEKSSLSGRSFIRNFIEFAEEQQ